jgi:hypothetical protein
MQVQLCKRPIFKWWEGGNFGLLWVQMNQYGSDKNGVPAPQSPYVALSDAGHGRYRTSEQATWSKSTFRSPVNSFSSEQATAFSDKDGIQILACFQGEYEVFGKIEG